MTIDDESKANDLFKKLMNVKYPNEFETIHDKEWKLIESIASEEYGTCNVCHKKMNGTGCVGHFEIDGERYSRIGYGEDGNYDEDGCHDCGVKQFGDKHHWNCDNEKCPACRGQALGCDCDDFELVI